MNGHTVRELNVFGHGSLLTILPSDAYLHIGNLTTPWNMAVVMLPVFSPM
jgi:hypothetical protein